MVAEVGVNHIPRKLFLFFIWCILNNLKFSPRLILISKSAANDHAGFCPFFF